MLRFIYNEMTHEEALDMQHALDADCRLRELLDETRQLLKGLDTEIRSPRPQSVAAILQYAENETVKVELR